MIRELCEILSPAFRYKTLPEQPSQASFGVEKFWTPLPQFNPKISLDLGDRFIRFALARSSLEDRIVIITANLVRNLIYRTCSQGTIDRQFREFHLIGPDFERLSSAHKCPLALGSSDGSRSNVVLFELGGYELPGEWLSIKELIAAGALTQIDPTPGGLSARFQTDSGYNLRSNAYGGAVLHLSRDSSSLPWSPSYLEVQGLELSTPIATLSAFHPL